jgi:hypothetical protein
VFAFVALLVLVGFPVEYPAIGIPIYAALVAAVVLFVMRSRRARTVVAEQGSAPAESTPADACPRCETSQYVLMREAGFRCLSCGTDWQPQTCAGCGSDLVLDRDELAASRGAFRCPTCGNVAAGP